MTPEERQAVRQAVRERVALAIAGPWTMPLEKTRSAIVENEALLEGERDELRARRHPQSCATAAERLSALEAERDALREVLRNLMGYRCHTDRCECDMTDFCTCGMKQVADAARALLTPSPERME